MDSKVRELRDQFITISWSRQRKCFQLVLSLVT